MKIRIIFKSLHDCIDLSQINYEQVNSNNQKVLALNSNINTVNTPHSKSTRITEVAVTPYDFVIDYISQAGSVMPTLNTAMQTRDGSPSPIVSTVNSVRNNAGNTSLNTSLRKSMRPPNEAEINSNSKNVSPLCSPYLSSSKTIIPVSNNKIVDVKNCLAEQTGLKIDAIMLFTYTDKIRRVKDNEDISNFVFIKNGNSIFAIFYYKIEKNEKNEKNEKSEKSEKEGQMDNIKVCIDFYQNNIDKIVYEISGNCSIYMLKYLINKKLKNSFPIAEQSLVFCSMGSSTNDNLMSKRRFSLGSSSNTMSSNIISANTGNIFGNSTNKNGSNSMFKDLKDDLTIREILDKATGVSNLNSSTSVNNYQNTLLSMLLIRKGVKKCSIGLDFSFTFMRNMRKVNYDTEAPSYREVSDGVNFFCYCQNKECKLYQQMFVRNLGYDKYDVVKEMRHTMCPRCCEKNSEVRSLGFINSEWTYRGMLINKHNSIISGDGITIDSKLYVMNETHLLSQMEKMEMVVKENQNKQSKKYQLDFDLNLDSAQNSDESVDPLKDLDVQFSVKRKDLFPDPSNRTTFSKPHSNLNTSNLTGFNTQSYLQNVKSVPKINLANKSENFNSGNNLNNNDGSSTLNITQELLKENNNSDFEIRMDNTKSHSCCFGGRQPQKKDKEKDKSSCLIF